MQPLALGGDQRSGRIETQRALILGLLEERSDNTIQELRAALGARGHAFGYGSVQRFLKRCGITRKRDRSRGRAEPAGRPESAASLARRPARARSGTTQHDTDRLPTAPAVRGSLAGAAEDHARHDRQSHQWVDDAPGRTICWKRGTEAR